jgi:hypothetical protein
MQVIGGESAAVTEIPGPSAEQGANRKRPAYFSSSRRLIEAEMKQVERYLQFERLYHNHKHPAFEDIEVNSLRQDADTEWQTAQSIINPERPKVNLVRKSFRVIGNPFHELLSMWTGADYETAWAALHRAEGLLLLLAPDAMVRFEATKIRAILKASQDGKDSDAARYDDVFTRVLGDATATPRRATGKKNGNPTPAVPTSGNQPQVTSTNGVNRNDRIMLQAIQRDQFEKWEEARSRVRLFRNLLTCVIPVLVAALAGAALVQWLKPHFLPVDWQLSTAAGAPAQPGSASHSADVLVIELLGAFGALLSSVWAVSRLQSFPRFWGLPLAQLLLKLPVGASTALIGILLWQSGVLTGATKLTWDKVIPYAVLLGVAQEAVTRLVDNKANNLLDTAAKASTATLPSATTDAPA